MLDTSPFASVSLSIPNMLIIAHNVIEAVNESRIKNIKIFH